jgi:ubiquinone/menaquinone biosynthesis C-methylase UbiE
MEPRKMAFIQQVAAQYQTSINLDVRIHVYEQFSTNKYPWMWWVFDHFELPQVCHILEVGCGVGKLWLKNAHRICPGWEIILSDFSDAMLEKTRANLASVQGKFQFKKFGVEEIPFGPNTFDAVVANHMLYYAVSLDRALGEIHRVLRPNGKLYASTNGMRHLKEIDDLFVAFRGGTRPILSVLEKFNLDNGSDFLKHHFRDVKLCRRNNSLLINDPVVLTAFCLSLMRAEISQDRQPAFAKYIEQTMHKCDGKFSVIKDAGLFIAVKA